MSMRAVVLFLLIATLTGPSAWAKGATPAEKRRQMAHDVWAGSSPHELAALAWARQALPAAPTGADRDELFVIVRDEWAAFAQIGLGSRILASGEALGAQDLHALLIQ